MIRSPLLSYLFLFGILSNLVLPEILFLGKPIYPSYFISLIMLFIWILISSRANTPISISKYVIYIFLILFSMFISYAYALLFLEVEVSSSMFASELLRYIPSIPFLLMFNRIQVEEKQISMVVFLLFLLFTSIGLLQLLGFERAVTIYSYESHIDIAISGSRIVITGSDPNVGSIIASFFMIYFLSGFIHSRGYTNLVLAFTAFLLILATQSRTTIIGTAIVIISYITLTNRTNIFNKLVSSLILFVSIFYIQRFFDLSYLNVGLQTLKEGQNTSLNARLGNIDYILNNFIQSPILGWGNSLEYSGILKNIDSEFFLILQRYGIFGFIIIISLIFTLIKNGFKYRESRIGLFVLLMTFSLLFNMSTNVVFYGIKTSPIIIFLLLCISLQTRQREKRYSLI